MQTTIALFIEKEFVDKARRNLDELYEGPD